MRIWLEGRCPVCRQRGKEPVDDDLFVSDIRLFGPVIEDACARMVEAHKRASPYCSEALPVTGKRAYAETQPN